MEFILHLIFFGSVSRERFQQILLGIYYRINTKIKVEVISWAHCDTMDGPVLSACRMALKSVNVNYTRPFVFKKAEEELS
jgi:hypothetical protein